MKATQYRSGRQRGIPLQTAATVILWLVTFAAAITFIIPRAGQSVNMSGYLSAHYRLRTMGAEHDQDLYEYLALDVGDPFADRVSFHFLARASQDLDGQQDGEKHYIFDSITDTYNSPYNARLYYAYLDLHQVQGLDMVRLGRQLMWDTPVVLYMDGARVETSDKNPLGFKVGAYGGVPVHLFEKDTAGNALYGAYAQVKPWPGGKLQFHFTHADGDYLYGKVHDDLYAMNLWQSLGDYARFNVMYTRMGDQNRDLNATAILYQPDWDLMVQARYYELLDTQKILAIDFDPFFAALHDYYPYRQFSIVAYKGLGDNFGVEAGADMRKLSNDDNESRFNHEFVYYYGTLLMQNLPIEGLRASVTGEIWDSYTNQDFIHTFAADLTYRIDRHFRVSVGTDYSLYNYDYYLDTEHEHVRTYYTRLRYYPTASLRTDLVYRYEAGENDNFNWLEFNVTYLFGNGNSDEK